MRYKIRVEYLQQWDVVVNAESRKEAVDIVQKIIPGRKPDVEKTSSKVLEITYPHGTGPMDGSIFHPGCQSDD